MTSLPSKARLLAAQGLTLTRAARELGLSQTQMLSLSQREHIYFNGGRREVSWDKPEGDPEAYRQWVIGHRSNARWKVSGRRAEG